MATKSQVGTRRAQNYGAKQQRRMIACNHTRLFYYERFVRFCARAAASSSVNCTQTGRQLPFFPLAYGQAHRCRFPCPADEQCSGRSRRPPAPNHLREGEGASARQPKEYEPPSHRRRRHKTPPIFIFCTPHLAPCTGRQWRPAHPCRPCALKGPWRSPKQPSSRLSPLSGVTVECQRQLRRGAAQRSAHPCDRPAGGGPPRGRAWRGAPLGGRHSGGSA